MTTDDYPADMSNHVRDPKIFKKNEKYYDGSWSKGCRRCGYDPSI